MTKPCLFLSLLIVSTLGRALAFLPSAFQATGNLPGTARPVRTPPSTFPHFVATTFFPGSNATVSPSSRFDRSADTVAASEEPCVLFIDGQAYNLTAWAKAHPGGVKVLRKFHNKDATKAFHAAAHSQAAYKMLDDFVTHKDVSSTLSSCPVSALPVPRRPRWIQKLFTHEDPIGIHKYCGVFVLLHFIWRFAQMLWGADPAAGLGTRLGRGVHMGPALCLLPHAILSMSSLIFHTVPKERVVGKPMIWQEYRVHNIAFGMRSVLCTWLAWLSIAKGHRAPWRKFAVVGSCAVTLAAQLVADWGTANFRANNQESTTATMPYWDGCSVKTQKRFKLFYAYSQFMATLACIAVCNPAWSLAVLLAIQCASLFMTLVRKGLLTAGGYHIAYTITLVLPYFVGIRSNVMAMPAGSFPAMLLLGAGLFGLRARFGISKYALWLPIYAARIAVGDHPLVPHDVW